MDWHALAGTGAGHGPAWKAIASRLDATPKSCAPESDETRLHREAAKAKCGDVMWSVPYAKLGAAHCLDRDTLKA